ncbi:MAG TPA: VTT domain-containing protein [Thermoanaerobaculia bacterium]
MLDPQALIEWGGYAGLALIVFAETGLPVGFFLPGDSLLVTAGLFAATGHLDLLILNVVLISAAIAGDATGYLIGHRLGRTFFANASSRWYNRTHLLRTQLFYEQHGGKTIILARFIPILRTFAPIVAGISGMTYARFALFNVAGGFVWVISLTVTGFALATLIPGIGGRFDLVILLVVALSCAPPLLSAWKEKRRRRRRQAAFRQSIIHLANAVRATRWDWSPSEIRRILRTLTAGREATAILRDDDGGFEPLVREVADRVLSIDIVASSSPSGASMSEAAREIAAMESHDRFHHAIETLRELAGADVPYAGQEDDDLSPPAAWPLEGALLVVLHRRRGDRHEVCLRICPGRSEGRRSA